MSCHFVAEEHLLIASTSSVYGNNIKTPFSEQFNCNNPVSLYAATKISNEVMAHSYSHLFQVPTTMLRFFTVYGPWGRPDMALFKFTKNILEGKQIDIFNHGNMKRDFTNIRDLVKAINLLIKIIPEKPADRKNKLEIDNISETAPYRIINIGNSKPVLLIDFIKILENTIGRKAKKNFISMQKGDMKETFSNIDLLNSLTGFKPEIDIKTGLREFVDWYKSYYV